MARPREGERDAPVTRPLIQRLARELRAIVTDDRQRLASEQERHLQPVEDAPRLQGLNLPRFGGHLSCLDYRSGPEVGHGEAASSL